MEKERPPRVDVNVEHPQCPYCHDEVQAGGEQRACIQCRAWHHQACWEEGGQKCSACGEAEAPTERTSFSQQELNDVRPYRNLTYVVALVAGFVGGKVATDLAGAEGVWDFVVFGAALVGTAWSVVIAGLVFAGSRNRARLLALQRQDDEAVEERIEAAGEQE